MSSELILSVIAAIFVGLTSLLTNTKIKGLLVSLKGHPEMAASVQAIASDVRIIVASQHDLDQRVTRLESLPCHQQDLARIRLVAKGAAQ